MFSHDILKLFIITYSFDKFLYSQLLYILLQFIIFSRMYYVILANLFAIRILQVSSLICGPGLVLHPNGTNCYRCASGYYCPDSHNVNEIPTPAGSKSSWQQPVYCSQGSWQPLSAQLDCWQCPMGYYCGNVGNIKAMKCLRGTFSAFTQSKSCISRDSGSFSVQDGEADVYVCPKSYYCPSVLSTPFSCPKGKYGYNAISSDDCRFICDNNSFCDTWQQHSNPGFYRSQWPDRYYTCPAGYYCQDLDQKAPILCPAGTFSLGRASVCTDCGSGYYQDSIGSLYCKFCPVGYYCPQSRQTSPIKCGINQYSEGGATAACQNCNSNEYAPEGSRWCYICPSGCECKSKGKPICNPPPPPPIVQTPPPSKIVTTPASIQPKYDVWYSKTSQVLKCINQCGYGCVQTTCNTTYKEGCILLYEDYDAIYAEAVKFQCSAKLILSSATRYNFEYGILFGLFFVYAGAYV